MTHAAVVRVESSDAPHAATKRLSFGREYGMGLGGVVVVQAVVTLVTTRGNFFYLDDYLYFWAAHNSRMDVPYLRVHNYGHFAPLTRATYWAMEALFGLDYRAAQIYLILLMAFVTLAFCYVLHALRVPRKLGLPAALLTGTSVAVIQTVLWFGAGVHILTALAFSLATVGTFVRFNMTQSRHHLALSVAFFTLAVLTQEQPLLTLPFLFLLRYVLLEQSHLRVATMLGRFRHDWWVWLPFGLVAAAALANQLVFYPNAATKPDASTYVRYWGLAIFENFLPNLLGWKTDGLDAVTKSAVIVMSIVVVGGLVGSSVLRRKRSLRAWLVGLFIVVANLALVGWARAGVKGPQAVASDLQYYVTLNYSVAIAACLAWSGEAKTSRNIGSDRWRQRLWNRPNLATAAVIAVCVTAWINVEQSQRAWPPDVEKARRYFEVAERTMSTLDEPPGGVRIAPLRVPDFVLSDLGDKPNRQFDLLQLLKATVPNNATARTVIGLDERGVVRALFPTPLVSVPLSAAYLLGMVEVDPRAMIEADQENNQLCITGPADASTFNIRFDETYVGPGLFLALTYRMARDADLTIGTVADGTLSLNRYTSPLPANADLLVENVNSERVSAFAFSARPIDQRMCFGTLTMLSLNAAREDGTGCETLGTQGQILGATACEGSWSSPEFRM